MQPLSEVWYNHQPTTLLAGGREWDSITSLCTYYVYGSI